MDDRTHLDRQQAGTKPRPHTGPLAKRGRARFQQRHDLGPAPSSKVLAGAFGQCCSQIVLAVLKPAARLGSSAVCEQSSQAGKAPCVGSDAARSAGNRRCSRSRSESPTSPREPPPCRSTCRLSEGMRAVGRSRRIKPLRPRRRATLVGRSTASRDLSVLEALGVAHFSPMPNAPALCGLIVSMRSCSLIAVGRRLMGAPSVVGRQLPIESIAPQWEFAPHRLSGTRKAPGAADVVARRTSGRTRTRMLMLNDPTKLAI